MSKRQTVGRTTRQRRAWWGLALVLSGPVYPIFLTVQMASIHYQPLAVALPAMQPTLTLPFRASTGPYLLRIDANGADYDTNPLRCVLALDDPTSPSPQCTSMQARLRFHYRLQESHSGVALNMYQQRVEGDYGDREREDFSPFFGKERMGAEFGWINLKRGDYVLRITALQVPPELVPAAPRLTLDYHTNEFLGLEIAPFLLLSALLIVAGIALLLFAAFTKPSPRQS